MNFVEWPAKGKFVPLPGTMQVVSNTRAQLVIEGSLPDTAAARDRYVKATLSATDGHIDRLGCRLLYRHTYAEVKYDAAKGAYVKTGKWRKSGVGGIRRAVPWLGWLAQDYP